MRSRLVLFLVCAVVVAGIIVGAIYHQTQKRDDGPVTAAAPSSVIASPSPMPDASPGAPDAAAAVTDLTPDERGLSKATVLMTTTQGAIRFKFYSADAPKTVERIITLIRKAFYDGLTFHRVLPGFIIQTGDPQGTGAGGTGLLLRSEFNQRRHEEGAIGMARGADPHSADSQFYITLSPQPHLDHSFTVFGKVVEGLDVARKIQKGDKITTLSLE